jgi:hypothetical protein
MRGPERCGVLRPAAAVVGVILAHGALMASSEARAAGDEVLIRIELKNGVVTPQRVEAPARTRLKLDLYNLGDGPAEFESKSLRLERVLPAHGHATLIVRTLDPGEYDFFDDFQPGAAPAVIVAK